MDPSLSDFHPFWLMLRWGFPLLGIALLVHHFILNYFHQRAEEIAAMSKLVQRRPNSKPDLAEKAKTRTEPMSCVFVGLTAAGSGPDSGKDQKKPCTNTKGQRSVGVTLIAP